jgi:hypothetical protein
LLDSRRTARQLEVTMPTRRWLVLVPALWLLSLLPALSAANPVPAVACCLDGGECQILPAQWCTDMGGFPLEGIYSCAPNPCLGACCTEFGSCVLTDYFNCVVPMGIWLGAGATCDGDPCHMGACCLPNGTCAVLHESECVAQGGSYSYDGYPCPWTPCGAEAVEPRFPSSSFVCAAVPNPFTTETAVTVVWEARSAEAPLVGSVLDAAGRLVRGLAFSPSGAGRSSSSWDGRDEAGQPVPAGVYFFTVQAAGQTAHAAVLRLR